MTEFKFSNAAREMEVYGYDSVTKSHCRLRVQTMYALLTASTLAIRSQSQTK